MIIRSSDHHEQLWRYAQPVLTPYQQLGMSRVSGAPPPQPHIVLAGCMDNLRSQQQGLVEDQKIKQQKIRAHCSCLGNVVLVIVVLDVHLRQYGVVTTEFQI